jgi:hypothetical protein
MSTGLPRLRLAIVKLNKLQRMPENMSQLLSNETHMPKNLYQMSSENSYTVDRHRGITRHHRITAKNQKLLELGWRLIDYREPFNSLQ